MQINQTHPQHWVWIDQREMVTKRRLHIAQNSRTGVSPSDAVLFHTQGIEYMRIYIRVSVCLVFIYFPM